MNMKHMSGQTNYYILGKKHYIKGKKGKTDQSLTGKRSSKEHNKVPLLSSA